MNRTLSSSTGYSSPSGPDWAHAALVGGTLMAGAAIGLQTVTPDPQVQSDEPIFDRFDNEPRVEQVRSGTTHWTGMSY